MIKENKAEIKKEIMNEFYRFYAETKEKDNNSENIIKLAEKKANDIIQKVNEIAIKTELF